MSKLSQDLEAAQGKHHAPNHVAMLLGEIQAPGVDGYRGWAQHAIKLILRKAQAYHAGSDYWPDIEAAMLATSEYMSPYIYTFLVKTIGAGITIGYHKDSAEFDWDKLFMKGADWGQIAEENMSTFSEDSDAMEWLQRRIVEASTNIYQTMGLAEAKDKQTFHVWDLWNAAAGSCGIGCFLIGQEVGAKWREEEVLAGILTVTEWTPES